MSSEATSQNSDIIKRAGIFGPPAIQAEDRTIYLPVVCEPIWNREMGQRLMRARKWKCPRVDRRTADWRHKEVDITGKPCACRSQLDVAQQLSISQMQLSRIEQGRRKRAGVSVALLYSVFPEEVLFILVGLKREQFEGYPRKLRG